MRFLSVKRAPQAIFVVGVFQPAAGEKKIGGFLGDLRNFETIKIVLTC